MRIPCPYCGPRGNDEFAFRGGVTPPRPEGDDPEAWHRHVYLRDNVAGPQREYWQHVHGCRAWLVVTRDTRTHAVLAAEPAEQQP